MNFNIEPTKRTAIYAGIWSGFGFALLGPLIDSKNLPVVEHDIVFVTAFAIFLLLPLFVGVIGRGNQFDRMWFLDPVQRAKYSAVFKRMLWWFVSTGAFGTLASVITFGINLIWRMLA